jgi:hypothetical protein
MKFKDTVYVEVVPSAIEIIVSYEDLMYQNNIMFKEETKE